MYFDNSKKKTTFAAAYDVYVFSTFLHHTHVQQG